MSIPIMRFSGLLLGVLSLGAICSPNPEVQLSSPDTKDQYTIFSLNVQDFSYPEKSIETVNRVIDIHEQYNVPVDIYLTTTSVDVFEQQAPDLIERLKNSPVVTVAYHIRPPVPYHALDFDFIGLKGINTTQQYDKIKEFETHGLDLITGLPTTKAGSYAHLTTLVDYPPYVVGDASTVELTDTVDQVFADLGAQLFVAHGRAINLGDKRGNHLLRPEHVDVLLFQRTAEEARDIIDTAFTEAPGMSGAKAPYFIGIKMHDNDFFAQDSAWTTVYLAPGARRDGPPYDTSLKSPLIPQATQDRMWEIYEQTVEYAPQVSQVINAHDVLELLEQ